MLTIIWLHYMCKNWYLILMVLVTCNWYLPQQNSSNYSTKNVTQFCNTGTQSKDHLNRSTLTTALKTQPHLEEFQEIKGKNFNLLSKSQLESNLIFIGGVRARRTPRKARTLHKAVFSLIFTYTKKITSQNMSIQQEITNRASKIRHATQMTPGVQLDIHRVKQPRWNLQLIPRRITDLPKTIINQTPPRTSATELLG